MQTWHLSIQVHRRLAVGLCGSLHYCIWLWYLADRFWLTHSTWSLLNCFCLCHGRDWFLPNEISVNAHYSGPWMTWSTWAC